MFIINFKLFQKYFLTLRHNFYEMLYTRHRLDKAGEDLIGSDVFKAAAALQIVQKWRETHLYVAQELNRKLVAFFEEKGVSYDFSSMRIKRMESIEAKLRHNRGKHMKIGGLQDIGGMRYVFADIEKLDAVTAVLDDFNPDGFCLIKKTDYVSHPKESGYRGLHYIYKYSSDNNTYDGISIELQVRTRLQHAWAMAVETASLISKTSLKADIDDKSEWRLFFRLVSALFAREEKKPVYETFKYYDDSKFCEDYFYYERKKLVDQLSAIRLAADNIDFEKNESGYCVLSIDFKTKTVSAATFTNENAQSAADFFSVLESKIDENSAALMVAIENMKEIREAYPSYFLDTKKFIEFLSQFAMRCRMLTGKEEL